MSGMMIRLQRTEKSTSDSRSTLEHGVAALAANLQIPRLSEEDAASLASAEGLVTHLTSLVLVDEAAVAQDSIPLRRRVPLAQASGWGSVSHIAASMGVETWVVIPVMGYFLYAMEGDTCPYYDSMKLFRQETFGEWEAPFNKMKETLTVVNKAIRRVK
jgi:hypothetical protein